MKKEDWIIIVLLILILITIFFILGIKRADRICREANPNDINGYRFCLGI